MFSGIFVSVFAVKIQAYLQVIDLGYLPIIVTPTAGVIQPHF